MTIKVIWEDNTITDFESAQGLYDYLGDNLWSPEDDQEEDTKSSFYHYNTITGKLCYTPHTFYYHGDEYGYGEPVYVRLGTGDWVVRILVDVRSQETILGAIICEQEKNHLLRSNWSEMKKYHKEKPKA